MGLCSLIEDVTYIQTKDVIIVWIVRRKNMQKIKTWFGHFLYYMFEQKDIYGRPRWGSWKYIFVSDNWKRGIEFANGMTR